MKKWRGEEGSMKKMGKAGKYEGEEVKIMKKRRQNETPAVGRRNEGIEERKGV